MKSVRRCVEGAIEAGLEHLTLYAFSRENWERPAEEVSALMSLLVEFDPAFEIMPGTKAAAD
jgi:undecaprenyl diphosphate synthase